MKNTSLSAFILAVLLALGLPVSSQTIYPNKPIRYIVPVAAGGGSDMVGRTVTERWGKVLNQTFVVENQGGGGGVIASQNTVKAAPDGYTLLQGYVAAHGTSPATRKLPFDAVKDFTPIGMIGGTPNVLVVNNNLLVRDYKEFIGYLNANKGRLSYGSAGQGSLTHLSMELLKSQTNTYMMHIPYRGIAQAFTDLIGGQTQAMFPGLVAAMPHLRGGRIKALAVTGKTRHPQLKDVPTLDELGLKGFDAQQWYGVVGPAGMSPAVVKTLNESLAKILKAPDLREKLKLDVHQAMMALGIAASQPVGLREQFGTMSKPPHPGAAARTGLMAALMAPQGFTASVRALEAPRGFIQVAAPQFNWNEITDELGKRFEISFNTYKPFACGIVSQPSMDACAQLYRQGIKAEDIERMDLKVHSLVLELMGKNPPTIGLEGKFSVYHCCAVALIFGQAGEPEYSDGVVNRPDVLAMRAKVNAVVTDGIDEAAADVTAVLKDGRRIHIEIEHAIGSLERPMSDQDLEAKFHSQADVVLGAAKAQALMDMAWRMSSLANVNELTRLTV